MAAPAPQGTLGDHYAALAKQGKAPKSIARSVPPLPPELVYLWRIYCDLDATRSPGMAIGPITYVEIDAFQRVCGRLRQWEITVLRKIDRAYLEHQADAAKARSSTSTAPLPRLP